MQRLPQLVLFSAALVTLSGCAGTNAPPVLHSEPGAVDTAAPATEAAHPDPVAPVREDVAIPPESVLPLLEAEFALRGGQFRRALDILAQQSQQLTDPEVARRTLRLAEFLRDDSQALAAAIRLAGLAPHDGAAAATAMSLLARQGDPVKALTYAREAKRNGTRINAPLLVADYEALSENERAAVSDAISALATEWPGDPDIAIALALLQRETKAYKNAVTTLEGLLASDPNEERALVLWTQVQLDLEGPAPFARIAAVIENHPEKERLRLQYARLLAANQRFDEARSQFEILITGSPRNDEYLMAIALIDLELEAYDDAIESLQALIGLEQRLDESHYYLGRSHEGAGRADKAIAAYAQVGPSREFTDAKRRSARLLRANAGSTARFFEQQRTLFTEAAERLFLIEAEHNRQDSNEAAIRTYSKALAAFPTSMSLQYGRAMVHEAAGNIAAMEQDLRAILDNDPNNATTLNALGYTLTNHTTRYAEAAELIERALELAPGEPAMLDSLGWVYVKLGRLQEAESILREAYTALPDPEVAAHLGEALWAQGKYNEAKAVWASGLAQDAESPPIRDAINRLGVMLD